MASSMRLKTLYKSQQSLDRAAFRLEEKKMEGILEKTPISPPLFILA